MVSRKKTKKTRPKIDTGYASKILRSVPSEAFLFFTDVGQHTGEVALSLSDFYDKLSEIPLKSVEFHFKRRDFEKWIRETLGDKNLAERISKISRTIRGEDLRTTIQRMVKRRLSRLQNIMRTKSC